MPAQATLAALNSIAKSMKEVLKTLKAIEQKTGTQTGAQNRS
jgi:hypothetical protein